VWPSKWKTNRCRKTEICVNVPHGWCKRCVDFQLKGQRSALGLGLQLCCVVLCDGAAQFDVSGQTYFSNFENSLWKLGLENSVWSWMYKVPAVIYKLYVLLICLYSVTFLLAVVLPNVYRCRRLGSVMEGCLTYDLEVMGSTPSRVTINWLLLGWVTVGSQINHLSI